MRPICQAFNRRRSPSSSFGEANLPIHFVKKSSHQAFKSNSYTLKVCKEIFRSSFGKNPSSFEEQNFSPSGLQRKFLPIKFWEEPIKLLGTKSCHQTLEANPSSSTLGTIQSLQAFLFFSLQELLGYLLETVGVRGFILSLSLSMQFNNST
jgi:hypothetical protein